MSRIGIFSIMKQIGILFFLVLVACVAATTYEGYQVWRIKPTTERHREWLSNLEKTRGEEFDFWTHIFKTPGHPVDIMVRPNLQTPLRMLLEHEGLYFDVMIDDVGVLASNQMAEIFERRERERFTGTAAGDFNYNQYHTYEEIQQWVFDIADAYSDIVTTFQLGISAEGRPINGIKIRGSKDPSPKPGVWFEGGIHAREWVSPATIMGFTKLLLDEYVGGDNLVVKMFDNLDWYIVPSLNVDGYSYTWSQDRMWRKTRSSNPGAVCIGTDPNRNWPFEWGGVGTSPWECSDIYHGSKALSEVEVADVVGSLRQMKTDGQDFMVFIDYHSYSQVIIAPWSYLETKPQTEDYDDQMALASDMKIAINAQHGAVYEYGAGADILYACSGVSSDWGYAPFAPSNDDTVGGLGAKYSYTVELRDTGNYGFLLPENQIQPTYEENEAAVCVIGYHVLRELGIIN